MKDKIKIPEYNLGSYVIPHDCVKDVCVDVGANVGSFTTAQAQSFKKVHYYEPFSVCFKVIKEKTKEFDNVTGWNEAVYKEDNVRIPLVAHPNMDAGSNAILTDLINQGWGDEIEEVNTVSLPTVLERVGGHINYLKVDCEASEYYFLINQDLSKIDYIGIELHCQLPKEKYEELLHHIGQTHNANKACSWISDLHEEVLFTNRKL